MQAGGERAYRVIEEVTGPLVWESDTHARGMVRGQPVWIEIVHGHRQTDMFRIGVSLEGRPVVLAIHRRGSIAFPARELKTGVTAFDDEYEVRGDPPDVVQPVLDLQTLDWVWRHFHGRDPQLSVHEGRLSVMRDLPSVAAESMHTSLPAAPRALYDLTTGLQDLAGRLMASYDQAYRHVTQAHGDAAAVQWERLHESRGQQLQRQRSPGTSYVRGCAITVGVIAVIAVAVVIWLALSN